MENVDAVQRIAAAVTPAVMVSACGLLALGLDNQAARMTGRLRDLAREFRTIAPDAARAAAIRDQTRVLSQRHGLYTVALMCNYGALLCFVLTSATALGAVFIPSVAFAFAFFAAGVVLLGALALSTLLSVRLSRRAIVVEEREILAHRTETRS